MLAILHVLAVGFENARVGTGLGKNFAEHREIETERIAERETFGKSGGIDVHDHVNERLHLGGLARAAT